MRAAPACDAAEIDQRARDVGGARRDVGRDVAARPEMRFVDAPQRLHRDVEGAAAQRAEALACSITATQLGRRPRQHAVAIEARDLAVVR